MRTMLLASTMITAMLGLANVAMADPFLMGSNSIGSLGDEIGSGYDTFTVTGYSGTTEGLVDVATLAFDAGPNCYACSSTPSGSLPVALTIGGVMQSVSLPWNWYSTGSTDYLNLGPIDPLTYDLAGGEIVSVSFVTPAVMSSTGGVVSEVLDARFDVPEPASVALVGAGLFGLGMIRRRRA
jgi:PEP-CTERM motif